MFITKDELRELTGCTATAAQIIVLKKRRIKHFVNPVGVVVTRVEFERVQLTKRPSAIIPTNEDIQQLTAMPRNGCGIYFLFQGDEIVYIGKTKNFFSRMSAHDGGDYIFDTVKFLPVQSDMLDAYEREYIARYKPRFNKMLNVAAIA